MKQINKGRLKGIQQLPDKCLGILRRNGFVFDGQQGPWQKIAFSLYAEIVNASTKAGYVLEEANEKKWRKSK